MTEKVNLWFFQTISQTSSRKPEVHRARLLSGQYIPLTDIETGVMRMEMSNDQLNLQVDDEIRKSTVNVVGTVFACTKIHKVTTRTDKSGNIFQLSNPYYTAAGDIFVLTNGNRNADAEIMKAYMAWKSDSIPPFLARFEKPKEIEAPEKGTLIGKLLKKYPMPKLEDTGFLIDIVTWMRLIYNLEVNNSTLILGPSGTGKTQLCSFVAEQFKFEYTKICMASKLDPVASLVGTHRHNLKQGGSYFNRASFTYAIEKPNSLILLDELSRANPQANNILLPCLDERRELHMDLAETEDERTIKINKDVRFIATANEGSSYTGTIPLDTAVKSRFKIIRLNHLSVENEAKVLAIRTKCTKKDATIIAKAADAIRENFKNGSLSYEVSMRETLDAAEMVKGGFSVTDALTLSFLPEFSDQDATEVYSILQRF